MAKSGKKKPGKKRVAFRRNRQRPARQKRWDSAETDDAKVDLATGNRETVQAKGDLSRMRTVHDGDENASNPRHEGTVVAVRGQFVDVDDGTRVWPCTVRRILRTRLIRDRHPVVTGDRVMFAIVADQQGQLTEGVIEQVQPRRSALTRCDGRRTHTIAANVDQVIVVGSMREPRLKPHLIDRYLVAAHAGRLDAIVCLNKIDLAGADEIAEFAKLYQELGYPTVPTSTHTGEGIDALRALMKEKVSLLAGQSGVGKSSLLNAIQPGLNLTTGEVSATNEKGRHTTTTAVLLQLDVGGSVVDTPGIRALDVAMVPLHELETHFIEFQPYIAHCKFPDCVHIHEEGCAIRAAVEAEDVDPDRYHSYVTLFYELSEVRQRTYE